MSQLKRSDVLFYIILIIIILSFIGGTFLAIKFDNKNKEENEKKPKEPTSYLTFKEVAESDTIDVFKKYPVNPIKFDYSNDRVLISGLKDKDVQNKINEKLSTLDVKKSGDSYNCRVDSNISNVLSITCDDKTININLNTGDDIVLEDVFNKETDIHSILVKTLYDNVCQWDNCFDKKSDYPSRVENEVTEVLKAFKYGNYNLTISPFNIVVSTKDHHNLGDSYSYIQYVDYKDEVTIFDRFINEDIFENKIENYCEINNCNITNSENNYSKGRFVNEKVYVNFNLINITQDKFDYSKYYDKNIKLDLEEYGEMIEKEILKKNITNLDTEKYHYIDIYMYLFYHTSDEFHVVYNFTDEALTKENFIDRHLYRGINTSLDEKTNYKINMLIDKNKKITYMEDEPRKVIPDFENKLYDYIMESLKENNYDFKYYNNCEETGKYEDLDKCERDKNYRNLIEEASYAVDEATNMLHIYEMKRGMGVAKSRVVTSIPLEYFKEKTSTE